jgi:hypothetical protein
MEDTLVRVLVVLGACEIMVLLLTWYGSGPDDG